MFRPIATLFSIVFCSNLLHASNLSKVVSEVVQEKSDLILGTQFELELTENTVLPETMLQFLSDNLFIYQKLEEKLKALNHPIICPELFRSSALEKDIAFLSFSFDLSIPPPTQTAINLRDSLSYLNARGLLIAYYTFYISLFSPARRNAFVGRWVSRYEQLKSSSLVFFSELYEPNRSYVIKDTIEYFSKILLLDFEVKENKALVKTLVDLMVDLEKNIYKSEFVLKASKPTLTDTYNEEMANFFQSKL